MSPTGKMHNVFFVLLPESLLPTTHVTCLPGKQGKSMNIGCYTE